MAYEIAVKTDEAAKTARCELLSTARDYRAIERAKNPQATIIIRKVKDARAAS